MRTLTRISMLFLAVLVLLRFCGPDVHAQKEKKKLGEDKFMADLLREAQNQVRFFAKPETTPQYWTAIHFEITQGKFELAGLYLKLLLEKMPAEAVDADLVQIEQVQGYPPFLKLQDLQKWSENEDFQKLCKSNVKLLLKRLTAAVERYLSAPERIKKFIANLNAETKEERDYAFVQLQRSRERAVPYMVDILREKAGQPIHRKVVDAFMKLDRDFMFPLLEILKAADLDDAKEPDLRLTVLSLFRRRADSRCIPYLWHLSSSKIYPSIVRDEARDTLAYLLETDPIKLPSSKQMLVQMAERYYQHKAKIEIGGKPFWRWDGLKLALHPDYIPRREAEEFLGVRYAKEALDLDPAYKPAQIVMLNFILERSYDLDLDQFFKKPMTPEIEKLLIGVDFDLLMETLERALNENKVPVALPIIEILGKRGDLRAAQPGVTAPTAGLPHALFYSDRRVQFAAVTALLRMPYRPVPVASQRVVELLRRFMVSEPISRAIVVLCPEPNRLLTEKTFAMAGFPKTEVRTETMRESFERIHRSADFDVIFVHPSVNTRDLMHALAQFRGDLDCARLPLIVLAPRKQWQTWIPLVERYPNTWVELDMFLATPKDLFKLAEEKIFLSSGAKLSDEERKKFTSDSMNYIAKMGRDEIRGYDLTPIKDDLQGMIRTPEFASLALETAARINDKQTQTWLAYVVLDPAYAKLKLQATIALTRHVQKNGLQLTDNDIARLKGEQEKAEAPELRTELSLLLSNLRTSPRASGLKLQQYVPAAPK